MPRASQDQEAAYIGASAHVSTDVRHRRAKAAVQGMHVPDDVGNEDDGALRWGQPRCVDTLNDALRSTQDQDRAHR